MKLLIPIAILIVCIPNILSQQVDLRWDANTETDLVGYNVYRSQASGSGYARLTTGGPQAAVTYTDSTIQYDTPYFWVVTAVDNLGEESGFSNEVTTSIPDPDPVPGPPAPPGGLIIESQGANLNLDWNPVPDADSYIVEYAKTGQAVRTHGTESTRFRTKLKRRQTFRGSVQAVQGLQISEPSEEVVYTRR